MEGKRPGKSRETSRNTVRQNTTSTSHELTTSSTDPKSEGRLAALEGLKGMRLQELAHDAPLLTSSTDPKSGGRLAALEGLKGVTLKELTPDRVHHGTVLYGRLCQEPIMQAELHTAIEDEFGCRVSVFIDNAWPRVMASPQECEAPFPKGLKVAIIEPHYAKWECGGGGRLRVSNPGKIVRIASYKDDGAGPEGKDETKVLGLLEAIRLEGNKLFAMKDWVGAVARYSECIDAAMRMGETVEAMSENIKNVACLAYSNRAEALLQFKDFVGALCDTESALELNPVHSKSLTRQGRAAMELELYEKAVKAFEGALKLCPDEPSIGKSLQASRKLLKKTRNGKFKNAAKELPGNMREKNAEDEHIGSVEVRRVNYGDGRRGLFSKELVKAYSVVIKTSAIADETTDPGKRSTRNLDSSGGFRGCSFGYGIENGLLRQLLQRAAASKRSLAQLYSLASAGDGQKEIPPMELFKLGSEWAPPSADTLELNANRIKKILILNGFRGDHSWDHSERGDQDAMGGGLWIVQSFINHSCVPNCFQSYCGNRRNGMSICALRDIRPGEELTIGYVAEMFAGLERRQQLVEKAFSFRCECERCVLEKQLKPELSQIGTQVGELVAGSKYEIAYDRGPPKPSPEDDFGKQVQFSLFKSLNSMYMESANPNARFSQTRQLADLADRAEALITSLDEKIAPHQRDWIRGSFLDAYLGKYVLVREVEPESSARIETLSIILKSMISICTTDTAMTLAQLLMHELKGRYSKNSEIFRKTKELVLQAIRVHYGIENSERAWSRMLSVDPEFDYSKFSFNPVN